MEYILKIRFVHKILERHFFIRKMEKKHYSSNVIYHTAALIK